MANAAKYAVNLALLGGVSLYLGANSFFSGTFLQNSILPKTINIS